MEEQIKDHEEVITPEENLSVSSSRNSQIITWVIVAVVVVAGIVYYYTAGVNVEEPVSQQEAEAIVTEIDSAPDVAAEKLQKQGTSDAVTDIESDLGITNLDNLDQELKNIEAELVF